MFQNEPLIDLADAMTDPPEGDNKGQAWVFGVIFAAIPLIYGIVCCVSAHAKVIAIAFRGLPAMGGGLFLDVFGAPAVSLGVFFIFVGCFMHFHYFWGNYPKLANYYEIGKYLSIAGIIAALAAYGYFTMFA